MSSLESSLSGQALTNYQQVVIVSQIIQSYLDVAISELDRFKDTVSLSNILRNRTELEQLVNATAAALPEALELLLTQPMSIQQVSCWPMIQCYLLVSA